MSEFEDRIAGLGILVVVPEDPKRGFASLIELRSRRSTNKLAGSRTVPMESLEVGETPIQTLDRLTREEIQLQDFGYDPYQVLDQRLCTCELRPNIFVPAYLLEVLPKVKIIPGSESQEVSGLSWTPFEDIIEAPSGDLSLRPGTREVVRSYMDLVRKPKGFKPRLYRYAEIADHIPDAIFDLIEAGFSVKEALFRLKLASAPFAKSLLLVHSQLPPVYPLNHAEAT